MHTGVNFVNGVTVITLIKSINSKTLRYKFKILFQELNFLFLETLISKESFNKFPMNIASLKLN